MRVCIILFICVRIVHVYYPLTTASVIYYRVDVVCISLLHVALSSKPVYSQDSNYIYLSVMAIVRDENEKRLVTLIK